MSTTDATAGTVSALFTAPAAGELMIPHQALELVPGLGIPGDRYAAGLGHWSDPQWPDQQLTLVEEELARELDLELALLRRNVVTRGIALESLIGREFLLGAVRCLGVRNCDPCRYIESLVRPGLFEQLAGRGGLRVAILELGTVRLGDAVVPVPA